jgi:hypothetical protein
MNTVNKIKFVIERKFITYFVTIFTFSCQFIILAHFGPELMDMWSGRKNLEIGWIR